MYRIEDKEDLETRYTETDAAIKTWLSERDKVMDIFHNELQRSFRISLIHHDAALEGEVLAYSEIKAAIDPEIVRVAAANPTYAPIKAYYDGLHYALDIASDVKQPIRLETVRKIHTFLSPETGSGQSSYRKENPLHRLYYHTIAPPEKLVYQMRKFGEWLDAAVESEAHPVAIAAQSHFKLMRVFPWTKQTGRCSRILSNLFLARYDWPLAIIHSIDRQRYYEALKSETSERMELVYLDAVSTTAQSSVQAYKEALDQGLAKR